MSNTDERLGMSRVVPSLPLLERGFEVGALAAAIDGGCGGDGQMVLLEGSSGIGKTRLLETAAVLAGERGADVLQTCGGELERDYPFGLVRRLLETRVAHASPAQREAIFRGHAQIAESLLQPPTHEDGPALADEFQLVHSLYWLVVNLADEKPLVLIADDLQWGDDLSLRFVLYLAQRLNDLPITLIGAVRTGDPSMENELVTRLMLQSDVTLRPSELSAAAVKQMLTALVPGIADNSAAVADSWTVTRGNPFLLRELASAMKSQSGEDLVHSEAFVARTAPIAVARSVMLRLAQMGSDAIAIARAVAILGTSTTLSVASELSGLGLAAAASAADRLRSSQIFSEAEELAFYHPMIRTAVYNAYPPQERSQAHLVAAGVLFRGDAAVEQIAVHVMRGAPTDAEWAGAALHAAARDAGRKGAPAVGVAYLRRALETTPPSAPNRARLLADLGIMEAAAGEQSSLSHLGMALELMDVADEKADAMYALGQTLFRYGRAAEALTVFRRGADDFADTDRDVSLRFEAGYLASASHLVDRAAEAKTRASLLIGPLTDLDSLSPSERLLVLHTAVFRTVSEPLSADHADLAIAVLGDGVRLWSQTSDAITIGHVILALTWCGRASAAAEIADRVLTEARVRGDSLIFAEISLARSLAMYALGRVNDAMIDAQSAIIGMKRGWSSMVPAPQGIVAYCLLDRGEIEEAAEVLNDTAGKLREGDTRLLNVWFYMARGRLRLQQGEAAVALDDFVQVGSLLESNGYLNPGFMLAPWRSYAGLAQHALGNSSTAVELIERDIELAEEFGLPATMGAAMRARAMVSPQGPDMALLEASAETLSAEECCSPLELARTLLELGACQRRSGQRVHSRDALRRALDLAHHAGALGLEHRAFEELLASGARPRRAVMRGADALTPSEQRIASLFGRGLTSRNIAESLYLTMSTVEWHRRNIYRKLDVASRDELKEALHVDNDG